MELKRIEKVAKVSPLTAVMAVLTGLLAKAGKKGLPLHWTPILKDRSSLVDDSGRPTDLLGIVQATLSEQKRCKAVMDAYAAAKGKGTTVSETDLKGVLAKVKDSTELEAAAVLTEALDGQGLSIRGLRIPDVSDAWVTMFKAWRDNRRALVASPVKAYLVAGAITGARRLSFNESVLGTLYAMDDDLPNVQDDRDQT
jgi:hypothetical protein